ncbi:MAG: hypothetical protein IJ870_01810 [Alphaproteobacteria bacterium]|nr:hypothetical protein [Alphaproteobacteria bacterium]
MKISHFLSSVALVLSFASLANAQTANITPYIAKNLPASALNNIVNSERVFCYTVQMAPSGYQGYTLDQMALTGYCGMLGEEKSVFIKEFFQTPTNISEVSANCQIEPKIMLRFIRGIDATDVLFSDTCPSITVFYGGTMKSFNAAPAQKSLEAVSSVFAEGRIDFVSPALLNQLMPTGVAFSDEDKAMVGKQNSAQPVRNWETPSQNMPQAPQQQAPKGWNKLKN